MSAPDPTHAFSVEQPLPIESAEILAFEGHFFARVRCGHWHGVAALNSHAPALVSLWQRLILPHCIGRDARDVEELIETIYRANSDFASAPFWMAVAAIELAIWDALGQASGQSVAALLNPQARRKVPVYLSSQPGASDESELETLADAVARAQVKAVKIRIGGRAGADEPGAARLVAAARARWGEKFVIYADAGGAFDAETAIEIGQMLGAHQVAWFEAPCAWEEFEATRAVAASVPIPVAGGTQESSWPRWKWLLENCVLDIAQPDLSVNGGLLRSFRLAEFAAQLGVLVAPHSPHSGPQALPALHFAAALSNPAPFLEWDANWENAPAWCAAIEVSKGAVALPKAPGWGATYDAEIWPRAEILAASRV